VDDKINSEQRRVKALRIRDAIHLRARVAALASRISFGEWIEQAIIEKLERESDGARPHSKEQK